MPRILLEKHCCVLFNGEWPDGLQGISFYLRLFCLQEEKLINPFLRTETAVMQKFTGKSDPVDVLAALRKAKDSF